MIISEQVRYEMSGAKFSVLRNNKRYVFTGDFAPDNPNTVYNVHNEHGRCVLNLSWDENSVPDTSEMCELVSSTLNSLDLP